MLGLAAEEVLATAEAARTGNSRTIEREPFQQEQVTEATKAGSDLRWI